jgi:hypothetical protein
VIDGIHFISVTLTGYKLASTSSSHSPSFATLTGPFSQVVDELGTTFYRGKPQQIDERTLSLFALAPYKDRFIIAERPVPLSAQDSRTIAIYPEEAPCVWEGQFAVLTGPFLTACDDDHHTYRCGEPIEICSKTFNVLRTPSYQPYFATINRVREGVTSEPVICGTSTSCC